MTEFQFALPRGERPKISSRSTPSSEFQFALPRGERRPSLTCRDCPPAFQFALPRGERPTCFSWMAASNVFQFALPRGERPAKSVTGHFIAAVSIRAPAWGATQRTSAPGGDDRFNSRSRVGSDASHAVLLAMMAVFQFALPRGERLRPIASAAARSVVSIRAPAWGATYAVFLRRTGRRVSIRAPAWGATRRPRTPSASRWFQFALPRGERRRKNG